MPGIPSPSQRTLNRPRKKCGAQRRGRPGTSCQRWASKGRERCRFHGGKVKRGAESHNVKTKRTHGLYAKHLLPEETERFASIYEELKTDPEAKFRASAAFALAKAESLAKKADPKTGMLVVRRSTGQRVEALRHKFTEYDRETGEIKHERGDPILNDDGKAVLVTVEQTQSAEMVDASGPATELMMRGLRMAEAGVLLNHRSGGTLNVNGDINVFDRETAAQLAREVFGEAGALEKKPEGEANADGPRKPSGPG